MINLHYATTNQTLDWVHQHSQSHVICGGYYTVHSKTRTSVQLGILLGLSGDSGDGMEGGGGGGAAAMGYWEGGGGGGCVMH